MPSRSLKFDTAEVEAVAEVFAEAAGAAPTEARRVLAKGALNIKNDARRAVAGMKHAPRYPASITYDSHETPTGGWAEIGPDKAKRQGALGNILEFGTENNPPRPHMLPAAERETPKFVRAMEDLAVKAIEP